MRGNVSSEDERAKEVSIGWLIKNAAKLILRVRTIGNLILVLFRFKICLNLQHWAFSKTEMQQRAKFSTALLLGLQLDL